MVTHPTPPELPPRARSLRESLPGHKNQSGQNEDLSHRMANTARSSLSGSETFAKRQVTSYTNLHLAQGDKIPVPPRRYSSSGDGAYRESGRLVRDGLRAHDRQTLPVNSARERRVKHALNAERQNYARQVYSNLQQKKTESSLDAVHREKERKAVIAHDLMVRQIGQNRIVHSPLEQDQIVVDETGGYVTSSVEFQSDEMLGDGTDQYMAMDGRRSHYTHQYGGEDYAASEEAFVEQQMAAQQMAAQQMAAQQMGAQQMSAQQMSAQQMGAQQIGAQQMTSVPASRSKYGARLSVPSAVVDTNFPTPRPTTASPGAISLPPAQMYKHSLEVLQSMGYGQPSGNPSGYPGETREMVQEDVSDFESMTYVTESETSLPCESPVQVAADEVGQDVSTLCVTDPKTGEQVVCPGYRVTRVRERGRYRFSYYKTSRRDLSRGFENTIRFWTQLAKKSANFLFKDCQNNDPNVEATDLIVTPTDLPTPTEVFVQPYVNTFNAMKSSAQDLTDKIANTTQAAIALSPFKSCYDDIQD